jgi:hypothetical protein
MLFLSFLFLLKKNRKKKDNIERKQGMKRGQIKTWGFFRYQICTGSSNKKRKEKGERS